MLSKYIGLMFLFLLTGCSTTPEISVYTWMQSHHWDRKDSSGDGYNETHEIIGVEYNNMFIETFKNSKNKQAWAAGYIKRDSFCGELLCLGYELAVIEGYGEDIQPIIGPILSYQERDWGVDLRALGTEVIALRFRYILEL